MKGFIPSNPQDWHRTQIEMMNWKADLEDAKKKQRRETRRYWITTAIALIALIKSFTPEILSIAGWLLNKLGI